MKNPKFLPKVSVVTVTFNCAALVEQTLEDVLRQTYPCLELVVIDGGSTDGTRELIERHADRLACFVSEADRGIYEAMNKGVRRATGEWVLFRNAGDFFFSPSTVENVFEWFEDRGETLITGSTRCFTADAFCDKPAPDPTASVWERANLSHPSTFIRRTALLANPYPEDMKIAADYFVFQKLLLDGAGVAVFPGFVSLFENEQGISSSRLSLSWKERLQTLQRLGAPEEELRRTRKVCRKLLFKEHVLSLLNRFPPCARFLCRRRFRGWTKCEKASLPR